MILEAVMGILTIILSVIGTIGLTILFIAFVVKSVVKMGADLKKGIWLNSVEIVDSIFGGNKKN